MENILLEYLLISIHKILFCTMLPGLCEMEHSCDKKKKKKGGGGNEIVY